MPRPACIKHFSEIIEPDDAHYDGSEELLSIGSPFGRVFGLTRLGIHHEVLPPGRRTSWPHAESTEEEFVYVIEGTPDVWLDGHLHRLEPGDGVGFKPGDGLAHTFINNTEFNVRLLVVGDTKRSDNQVHYPLHPKRNSEIGSLWWADNPERQLGSHDGLPDAQRKEG
ncbi:MAG: cupin domain-containing protein [Burkholderiales bacterium]|nr:cupin domain-containing protein [Burkholderiales bacterium]